YVLADDLRVPAAVAVDHSSRDVRDGVPLRELHARGAELHGCGEEPKAGRYLDACGQCVAQGHEGLELLAAHQPTGAGSGRRVDLDDLLMPGAHLQDGRLPRRVADLRVERDSDRVLNLIEQF